MGTLARGGISILMFCMFACGSSQEKTSKENPSDQPAVTTTDTLPPRLAPAPPSPAPGTVQIRGMITGSCDAAETDNIIYDIKVLKVLAVGAASPAVITGDTLQMLSSKKAAKLDTQIMIDGTLRYQQRIAQKYDTTAARWQLLDWNKTKIKNKQ